MRVRELQAQPFHSMECRVAKQGGRSSLEEVSFYRASTEGLPSNLAGLIVASDLQGVPTGREETTATRMLGEVVADELAVLAEMGEIPNAQQLGVILAGDLYAFPDAAERGGKGDVRPVWAAFGERFRWVAGVAGNHDEFGSGNLGLSELTTRPRTFYLDDNECSIDGMRIAGIGGIIGRPTKPFRRTEGDFVSCLKRLTETKPDLLVLHEAPEIAERGHAGSVAVRRALEEWENGLAVCGHKEWAEPLVRLDSGTQVLNVDFRVVVLLHTPGSF